MKAWPQIFPPALQFIAAGFILIVLCSCKDKNRTHPDPISLLWDFNSGTEGWSGDFAEYPVGEEAFYELLFVHDTLPVPLDQNQRALKLSGFNHNSDLFMFVKRKITGLEPATVYYASFTVEFATNEPVITAAASGNGNKQMFLAAGAFSFEPIKKTGENSHYYLNIGKYNPHDDEEDMVVIGNLSNDTDHPVYMLKTCENDQPFHCTTNEEGELWIIIGNDSAIDTTTTIYYNSITINLF